MSIHSLADEEKKSIEFDKYGTDYLGGALVSNFFHYDFLSPGLQSTST